MWYGCEGRRYVLVVVDREVLVWWFDRVVMGG